MQIVKVIYCFRILNSQQLLNSIPGISYSFKLSIDTNIRRKGQSSCNLSTFNFELRCLLRLVKAKKKKLTFCYQSVILVDIEKVRAWLSRSGFALNVSLCYEKRFSQSFPKKLQFALSGLSIH